MRRIISTIVCLLTFMSVHAQTASQKDFLTIREAMDIVSYRRYHPLTDGDMDVLIESLMKKYGYEKQHFLGEIGTCSFWEYIKNGYTVHDGDIDDHFIPYNSHAASTVAVVDCQGIETIDYDEVAISVEVRVFSEHNRDVLLGEMKDIGFRIEKSEDGAQTYAWHDYEILSQKFVTRGHDCWQFYVKLNYHKYDTTRLVEFNDSTRSHDLSISLEYPVNGNPALLRRIRTFMMEAIEPGITVDQIIPRFSGNPNDGQALVNYYGRKRCECLDKDFYADEDLPVAHCIESIDVEVVGENDKFISFEVFRYGNCGGSSDYQVYGATFRKSDGKRLRIIANPQDPKYKIFLNESLRFEDKGDGREVLDEEYKKQIPLPKHEPYLIQNGIRFTYQMGEIAVRPAGFLKSDQSFSLLSDFLTDEVKDLLK